MKFAVLVYEGINQVGLSDDKIKTTKPTIQASENFVDLLAFSQFEKPEFRDPTVLLCTFKGSHRGHENPIRVLEFLGWRRRRYTGAGSQFLPGGYHKSKH